MGIHPIKSCEMGKNREKFEDYKKVVHYQNKNKGKNEYQVGNDCDFLRFSVMVIHGKNPANRDKLREF